MKKIVGITLQPSPFSSQSSISGDDHCNDLVDLDLCHITGIIQFAAYEPIEESTKKPLQYHQNNVTGLIDVLAVLGDLRHPEPGLQQLSNCLRTMLSRGERPGCEEHLFNHEAADEDEMPLVPGVRGLTSPYVPDQSTSARLFLQMWRMKYQAGRRSGAPNTVSPSQYGPYNLPSQGWQPLWSVSKMRCLRRWYDRLGITPFPEDSRFR